MVEVSLGISPSVQGPLRKFGEISWMPEVQRLLPVAAISRFHSASLKAVIGSPGSAAISMTGIEGSEVIKLGRPQVALRRNTG